jgi:branched-chain amino acid transport system permease protein
VATRWSSFTGGDNGVGNIPLPKIGSLAVSGYRDYYYVVLIAVVLFTLAYRVIVRSPFGVTLRGIRESESRMRSLGYHVAAHKYAAFLLSSVLAGVAGVLYVYLNRFVSPPAAAFHLSAEVSLMAIVGGSGTILGPFLGSVVILIIRNYVSAHLVQWATVMGVVFILTVLYAPKGLMGLIIRRPSPGHSSPVNRSPRKNESNRGQG